MKIAIISSGGDCSGMNPAIKSFVEHCLAIGAEPFGIYGGLEGLIDSQIEPLTANSVAGIVHCGGTILRSSRSKRFLEPEARAVAAEQLHAAGINHLVMLGGDGSYRAMRLLHEETGIEVACIPATIDNDVAGTDYSLGVDSALNVIRGAIDSIRDTATSFRRAFVIETMGRHCGYLAIVSAITSGAEICLAPELEFDPAGVALRLLGDIEHGRRYAIAVVSEAVGGGSDTVKSLLENEIGLDSRTTVLGHMQRGGPPTVYDRRMAAELVTHAVDVLSQGRRSVAVGSDGGKISAQMLGETIERPPLMDPSLLSLAQRLAS